MIRNAASLILYLIGQCLIDLSERIEKREETGAQPSELDDDNDKRSQVGYGVKLSQAAQDMRVKPDELRPQKEEPKPSPPLKGSLRARLRG